MAFGSGGEAAMRPELSESVQARPTACDSGGLRESGGAPVVQIRPSPTTTFRPALHGCTAQLGHITHYDRRRDRQLLRSEGLAGDLRGEIPGVLEGRAVAEVLNNLRGL